ncbi:MAG: VCBS repeat-containing protein, partial [Planctomycetota bacterium]
MTAGVDYRQHNYEEAPNDDRQVYMTGGAAAGDYNNDGWVDLYVTRLDAPDILFENQGGTFVDVTTSAFGPNPMNIASNGAQWGDIDNDGDQDLYVTSIGTTGYQLYINDGNGQFSEQAVMRNAGVTGSDPHYGMSTSFGDYDLDGYLDIHTTEWREDAQIDYQDLPYNARLLRNAGASNPGHYTDVTVAAGVAMDDVPINGNPLRFEAQSFSSRFTDLDRDGHPDLIVASDHRTSRLYWNNGDGTFLDGTVAAGVGTDEYGMGSTVGDFDGDGDLDWFVTSIDDDLYQVPQRDGNRLYRNEGNRVFTDATDDAGVRHGDWGWGASFVDFDNDGDWDIAHTNGMDWPSPFFVPL